MSAATTGTQVALAGPWQIERDPGNVGRDEGWYDRRPGAGSAPATVPGLIQQTFPAYHGVAWYWTTFCVPDGERYSDASWVVLLRFDALDYMGEVWVDGVFAGRHEGGETPFELDLTAIVRCASPGAEHRLAVRVLNPTDEPIDGIVLNQTPQRNKRVD
jgi:beta-galactosidase/beta-glucuronidase